MNLFTLSVWIAALLPLAGHLFCLWSLRASASGPRRTDALIGILLGLVIVAANLLELIAHTDPRHRSYLPTAATAAALLLAIAAIGLMRRSGEFEVQSVGITAVIISLFSMASVVALGSLSIAG